MQREFKRQRTLRSGPYLDMFEQQIQDAGLLATAVFQQDAAPPYWAREVRDFLNTTFGDNWCGRGVQYHGVAGGSNTMVPQFP
jgi:hypothetical protein